MENFINAFEKTAKEHGWFAKQRGAHKAMTDKGDTLLGMPVANDDLRGKLQRKEVEHGLVGGLSGAALGALGGLAHSKHYAPAGALLGALTGSAIGRLHGVSKAQKEYLKDKGIESNWGGLSLKYSPEAAKKYLK